MRTRCSDNGRRRFPHACRAIAGAAIAVCALAMPASSPAAQPAAATEQTADLSEYSLQENLHMPAVPKKQQPYIKDYMLREARTLQKMGYKIETMRQGEVVIASIPASELFAPNDSTLIPGADARLKNFLPYFRVPGRFKVILAMHSDDTGSEPYLFELTERRIVALYDYFDEHARQTEMLMGYPMGPSEPLAPNDSRQRRADNRRLEIYLVPGPVLIAESKSRRV
ncbi:MAG: hypothetical protein K2G30_08580 [Muribaculaceae bacterium]|nr:hypothetical protein [Muribaculaceae bacterium]